MRRQKIVNMDEYEDGRFSPDLFADCEGHEENEVIGDAQKHVGVENPPKIEGKRFDVTQNFNAL